MIAERELSVGVPVVDRSTRCGRALKAQTLLLASLVVLLNSFGNLALTWGVRHSATVGSNPLAYLTALTNPFVELGICLLMLWMLTRMALLSWADLTFVLPVTGMAYVLAAVLGSVFLHETVSGVHWLGIFLISAGTAMVGSTNQRTEIHK